MTLTEREWSKLQAIRQRLRLLRDALSHAEPEVESSLTAWHDYLAAIKTIQGNASNDLGFISCLLAKEYLEHRFPLQPFDVAEKPMGAPGLDLDVRTVTGERLIAEIKATTPYKPTNLGANQLEKFTADFRKLAKEKADFKFFFVTEPNTFEVVQKRYASQLPGVTVVLVPEGRSFDVPGPEPLQSAKLRGLEARKRLIEAEGGVLSAKQTATELGITEETLQVKQLLGLPWVSGIVYPAWQLRPPELLPQVSEILGLLPVQDPWMQASFFLTGDSRLDGATPLEELRRGNIEGVRRAASVFGTHSAA